MHSPRIALKPLAGCLCLASALLLAGCGDGGTDDGRVNANVQNASSSTAANSVPVRKSDEGSIKAEPNPVPAGTGEGRSKITWSTKGNVGDVEVYVSENNQPEALFGQGSEAAVDAPWIQTGTIYEFRLYAGQGPQRRLIDKVQVTRAQ